MGAGKTTVGEALAAKLRRPFIDSDAQILKTQNYRTVKEIFLSEGEAAFRKYESEALEAALLSDAPAVIAAAGGAVLDQVNRDLLARHSIVVWLRARIETLSDRVVTGQHRPLLDHDPEETLRRLNVERLALYSGVSDHIIDVDERSPAEIADEILELLG